MPTAHNKYTLYICRLEKQKTLNCRDLNPILEHFPFFTNFYYFSSIFSPTTTFHPNFFALPQLESRVSKRPQCTHTLY